MKAMATITYRVHIPEGRIEELMEGQEIEEGDEGYAETALELIESDISDNPDNYLEFASDIPDVEVDEA